MRRWAEEAGLGRVALVFVAGVLVGGLFAVAAVDGSVAVKVPPLGVSVQLDSECKED